MTNVDVDWQELGAVAPRALVDARLELHWAAQLVGAVPLAFLDQEPDFSHANLGWNPGETTFVTRRVGSTSPIRAGLNVRDFALTILDGDDRAIERLPLQGMTLDDGYQWIAEMMRRHGVGEIDPHRLQRPAADFPDHPVGAGAAFTAGAATARHELARWYSNALLVLSEVVRDYENASPVRTWPHHFDIATLITLEHAEDAESTRSVGVGMAPGDSSYAEPYLYVAPWPVPRRPTLPGLDGTATWHTEGWVGTVLTGTQLVAAAEKSVQAERARAYLAAAIPAVRRLAGA